MTGSRFRARTRMRAGLAAIGATCLQASFAVQALSIEFDYRYDTRGFFTDVATGAPIAERRAALAAAASYYSGFTDALQPIAPGAGNAWSVQFTHPSLDGPAVTLANEAIAADTLRIFVGGSSSAPGVLGFANTGVNLSASGAAGFVDAVTTRGQANATGAAASDYATWGGMIWFNATQDWHFGTNGSGPSPGHPDFLTTATHELGHILGFGEADSWRAQIGADGRFLGASSVAAYGEPIPLDTFESHWAEGTLSTRDGIVQESSWIPPRRAASVSSPARSTTPAWRMSAGK